MAPVALSDPYKVLGVPSTASAKEISKAYRALAKKHHPDSGGDDEHFKRIAAAHDMLSDPETRRAYDESQFLSESSPPRRPGPSAPTFSFADFDLSSFFDTRPQSYQVSMELRDTLAPSLAILRIPRTTICPQCRGLPLNPPCVTCHGFGSVSTEKRLSVRLPAGVVSGDILRVPSGTEQVTIEVYVEEDPIFRVQGRDLVRDVVIDAFDALLGAVVEVQGPLAPVRVRVPEGTQSATVLRVRGLGIPGLNGAPPGDLLCRVQLSVPRTLSNDQRRTAASLHEDLAATKSKKRGSA